MSTSNGSCGTNPEFLASYRLDVAEAVGVLPVLDGTLTDAIDEMPWHERSHRGNFLHNAMHAAGWALTGISDQEAHRGAG